MAILLFGLAPVAGLTHRHGLIMAFSIGVGPGDRIAAGMGPHP
jgi:hypothetical protein